MKYNKEDLIAEFAGRVVRLNPKLLREKNITDPETIKKIVNSHVDKLKIFAEMDKTDDVIELHGFAKQIENLEFVQQDLWGFPRNSNYHYWNKVPKCTCPRMDNADTYGTKYRNIDMQCPVHGEIEKPKKKRRTFWTKWF